MHQIKLRIENAKNKIISLFLHQCIHGRQNQVLPKDVTACGQFIGEAATSYMQRGVHGTAAALRILAQSQDPERIEVISKLLRYLDDRSSIEAEIPNGVPPEKCKRDDRNVIKIAETLHALSFLPGSDKIAGGLIQSLVGKLKTSLVENRGWPYFTTEKKGDVRVDLIPTAYATIALSKVREDVSGPVQYIVNYLIERSKSQAPRKHDADITTDILCLYALHCRENRVQRIEGETKAFSTLEGIWRVVEPWLAEDIEQNIEYSDEAQERMSYVRIPWQIYVLAITCKYSPRRFCSFTAQKRLKRILDSVESNGFVYPHSGRMISSRTNAILFDVLTFIGTNFPKQWKLWLWKYLDKARVFISSKWFRYAVLLMLIVFGYISLEEWLERGADLSSVGPGIINTIIGLLLLLVKGR